MIDVDRDQLRSARRAVIGQAQQRRIALAEQIAATSLQQMGEAHARRRAVEIGNVALEPDCARLALADAERLSRRLLFEPDQRRRGRIVEARHAIGPAYADQRSEEHTSELQSPMRISYSVFCLTQKNKR